ncbi:MAG TPA: hypothetical protein VGE59_03190 [Patescibacteria group bacterium]
MISWKDLSLPPKIIALIIAIILGGGTLFFTFSFVYGRVTLSSSSANAFTFTESERTPQALPLTLRKKPGKYLYVVGAPGKLNTPVVVKVYAFFHRKLNVALPVDYSTEQDHFRIMYDYENESYQIVPYINFGPDLSPREQLKTQWTTYEVYAKEAIAYLKAQGADTKKLPVMWWAKEWWPEGKALDSLL